MPKISTYNTTSPKLDDKLIGTDTDSSNATKNFTIGDIIALAPGGSSSVQSLNSLVGALNVVAGNAGITVTTNGSNEIIITNAGTGGNYLEDVFVTGGVAQLGVILTVPEGAVSLTDDFATSAKIIEVSFPSTLTSTSSNSFSSNLLTEVDINNITSVGNNSFFYNQYLNTLNLRSVQTIGGSAFSGAGVLGNGYDLVFPSTLTSIGPTAFSESKINSVTFDAANQVTNLQSGTFANTIGFTSITLPSNLITIGDSAFQNSDLTSIIVPNSVTSIGQRAFESSPLTSAVINNGTIGDSAFRDITTLTSLTLNSGVTSIGTQSFQNLGITTVTIPSTVTSMGTLAFFSNSNLTSAIINSTVIGTLAFKSSPLLSTVTLSNNLLSIGNEAFMSTGLTSVVIPNTVTSLGTSSFKDTSLSSIVFDSVSQITDIPQECFADSWENTRTVTTLTLPEAVQTFGIESFQQAGIQTLAIPNTTTTINEYAFGGQRYTTFAGTDPALDWTDAIRRGLDTLTFDATSVVSTIGNYAFEYNNISSLVIPPSVTFIGIDAFRYNNLTSVILPATVTTVGNDAFSNNPNLTDVTINSTQVNANYAFDNIATTITTVNIGPGVTAASGIFTGSTGIGTLDIAANAVTNNSSFDNLTISNLNIDGTAIVNGYSFNNSIITLATVGNGFTFLTDSFRTSTGSIGTINIGDNATFQGRSFRSQDITTALTVGNNAIIEAAGISSGAAFYISNITNFSFGTNLQIQGIAFFGATLTGNFVIDSSWTIAAESFNSMTLVGDFDVPNNFVLSNDIFTNGSISGDLILGTNVTVNTDAFEYTDIAGTVNIPSSTVFVGDQHFASSIIGTMILPNTFVFPTSFLSSSTVTNLTIGDNTTVTSSGLNNTLVTNCTIGSDNVIENLSSSAEFNNLTISGFRNNFFTQAFSSNEINTLTMAAPPGPGDLHTFGNAVFQSNNISAFPAYFQSAFVSTLPQNIFETNNFSGNITIPSNLTIFESLCLKDNSITGITNAAPGYAIALSNGVFRGNNFTAIPDFLQGIASGIIPIDTFIENDFVSITLDAVTNAWVRGFSSRCFTDNTSLTTLSFDAGATTHSSNFIGTQCFQNCNISSVTFLATGVGSWNIDTITGTYVFDNNNLSALPTGLYGTGSVVGADHIRTGTFRSNSFSGALFIPDGVTQIDDFAFTNNAITSASVKTGTTVAANAFDPSVTITIRP